MYDLNLLAIVTLDGEIGNSGLEGSSYDIVISAMLEFIKTQPKNENLSKLFEKLQFLKSICETIKTTTAQGEFKKEEDALALCSEIAKSIYDTLYKDQDVYFPGGWKGRSGKNEVGHGIIYRLFFESNDDNSDLVFIAYNTGSGLQNHHETQMTADLHLKNKFKKYYNPGYVMKFCNRSALGAFGGLQAWLQELMKPLIFPLITEKTDSKSYKYDSSILYREIFQLAHFLDCTLEDPSQYIKYDITGQRDGSCAQQSLQQLVRQCFHSRAEYRYFLLQYRLYLLELYLIDAEYAKFQNKENQQLFTTAIANTARMIYGNKELTQFLEPVKKSTIIKRLDNLSKINNTFESTPRKTLQSQPRPFEFILTKNAVNQSKKNPKLVLACNNYAKPVLNNSFSNAVEELYKVYNEDIEVLQDNPISFALYCEQLKELCINFLASKNLLPPETTQEDFEKIILYFDKIYIKNQSNNPDSYAINCGMQLIGYKLLKQYHALIEKSVNDDVMADDYLPMIMSCLTYNVHYVYLQSFFIATANPSTQKLWDILAGQYQKENAQKFILFKGSTQDLQKIEKAKYESMLKAFYEKILNQHYPNEIHITEYASLLWEDKKRLLSTYYIETDNNKQLEDIVASIYNSYNYYNNCYLDFNGTLYYINKEKKEWLELSKDQAELAYFRSICGTDVFSTQDLNHKQLKTLKNRLPRLFDKIPQEYLQDIEKVRSTYPRAYAIIESYENCFRIVFTESSHFSNALVNGGLRYNKSIENIYQNPWQNIDLGCFIRDWNAILPPNSNEIQLLKELNRENSNHYNIISRIQSDKCLQQIAQILLSPQTQAMQLIKFFTENIELLHKPDYRLLFCLTLFKPGIVGYAIKNNASLENALQDFLNGAFILQHKQPEQKILPLMLFACNIASYIYILTKDHNNFTNLHKLISNELLKYEKSSEIKAELSRLDFLYYGFNELFSERDPQAYLKKLLELRLSINYYEGIPELKNVFNDNAIKYIADNLAAVVLDNYPVAQAILQDILPEFTQDNTALKPQPQDSSTPHIIRYNQADNKEICLNIYTGYLYVDGQRMSILPNKIVNNKIFNNAPEIKKILGVNNIDDSWEFNFHDTKYKFTEKSVYKLINAEWCTLTELNYLLNRAVNFPDFLDKNDYRFWINPAKTIIYINSLDHNKNLYQYDFNQQTLVASPDNEKINIVIDGSDHELRHYFADFEHPSFIEVQEASANEFSIKIPRGKLNAIKNSEHNTPLIDGQFKLLPDLPKPFDLGIIVEDLKDEMLKKYWWAPVKTITLGTLTADERSNYAVFNYNEDGSLTPIQHQDWLLLAYFHAATQNYSIANKILRQYTAIGNKDEAKYLAWISNIKLSNSILTAVKLYALLLKEKIIRQYLEFDKYTECEAIFLETYTKYINLQNNIPKDGSYELSFEELQYIKNLLKIHFGYNQNAEILSQNDKPYFYNHGEHFHSSYSKYEKENYVASLKWAHNHYDRFKGEWHKDNLRINWTLESLREELTLELDEETLCKYFPSLVAILVNEDSGVADQKAFIAEYVKKSQLARNWIKNSVGTTQTLLINILYGAIKSPKNAKNCFENFQKDLEKQIVFDVVYNWTKFKNIITYTGETFSINNHKISNQILDIKSQEYILSQYSDIHKQLAILAKKYPNNDKNFDNKDIIKIFSSFEDCQKLQIWPKQKEIIETMLKNPNLVRQLIMGGGKSKVILPLLSLLKPNGKNLVFIVVPDALLANNYQDLNKILKTNFNREAIFFRFDRKCTTEPKALAKILADFEFAQKSQQCVITSNKSLQSLELKYFELLNEQQKTDTRNKYENDLLKASINYMQDILLLLRNNAELLIDEIHEVLDIQHELNYAIGASQLLNEKLYQVSLEIFKAFKKTSNNTLYFPKSEALQAELNKFKANFSVAEDNLESKLILREQLEVYLPITLQQQLNVEYGRTRPPITDQNILHALPYSGSNNVTRNLFDNFMEAINYTIQMVYLDHDSISFELFVKVLKNWQEDALKYHEYDYITDTQKLYEIINNAEVKFADLKTLDLSNTELLKDIYNHFKSHDLLKEYALQYFILPSIKYYPNKLTSNGINLVSMAKKTQGFSGTLENYRCYHDDLVCNLSGNLETKEALKKLLITKNAEIITEPEGSLDVVVNLVNAVKNYKANAFIDAAALFANHANKVIALEFAKHLKPSDIRYILYFDKTGEEDKLCALNVNKLTEIIELHDTDPNEIQRKLADCPPEQRFTYYDQSHTIGTDIKQAPQAIALVSASTQTSMSRFLQAIARMRELKDNQQVVVYQTAALAQNDLAALYKSLESYEIHELQIQHFKATQKKLNNAVRNYILNLLLQEKNDGPRAALFKKAAALFIEIQSDDVLQIFKDPIKSEQTRIVLDLLIKALMAQVSLILQHEQNTLKEILEGITNHALQELDEYQPNQRINQNYRTQIQVEQNVNIKNEVQNQIKTQTRQAISYGALNPREIAPEAIEVDALAKLWTESNFKSFEIDWYPRLFVSKNCNLTHATQQDIEILQPYAKPCYGVFYKQIPGEKVQLSTTMLAQEEIEYIVHNKKLSDGQWIETLDGKLLAGDKPQDLVSDYQALQEQILFYNGKIADLVKMQQFCWLEQSYLAALKLIIQTKDNAHTDDFIKILAAKVPSIDLMIPEEDPIKTLPNARFFKTMPPTPWKETLYEPVFETITSYKVNFFIILKIILASIFTLFYLNYRHGRDNSDPLLIKKFGIAVMEKKNL